MIESKNESIPYTDLSKGLSAQYVQEHLKSHRSHRGGDALLVYQVFLNQIRSIFFVLLLVSALLSYYLGNHTDALIFAVLNIVNVIIGFLQEFKASKASKTLEKMVRHTVTVLRDGVQVTVPGSEIVEGDVVYLAPGTVLVADMTVRVSHDAAMDESIRTGETLPREINEGDVLFAGTSLVAGTVVAQVTACGDESSLVKYGKKLQYIQKDNNFARFIKSVSLYILLITVICLVLVAVYAVVLQGKYTATTFILFSISMLVGVVPESLSLIITLMLTREALILSKEGVIVKNLTALQQLGSIRYLLTDKTGTLTENSIRLVESHDVKDLDIAVASIACAVYERTPMDAAFDTALEEKVTSHIDPEKPVYHLTPRTPIVTPFSNKAGYASFDFGDIVVRRGQFKSILDKASGLMSYEKEYLTNLYAEYESKGLRVIAYASAVEKPGVQGSGLGDFVFNGMVVFEDPLKSDASASYLATEGLGIRVKILTGDSVLVSKYVAKELDPHFDESYVEELGALPIKSYSNEDIEKDRVYARCMPEQKLDLINRHIEHGAVGFMGEGINDALALKRADVGIAVTNASDVARQSADILLTEKSLQSVIRAIQLSRRAYAHISTYLLCTLTGNIGTLISLTAVAMFWTDLPMLPIQILLNNLLTDVPLILLITDHLAKTEYEKPINHSAKEFFKTIFIFALISSAFDMIYFFVFKGQDLETLQTGWFVFSVCCELVLVFSLRSNLSFIKSPHLSRPLAFAMVGSIVLALAIVYIPVLNSELSLVPLSLANLIVIFALVCVYFAANESYKKIRSMARGPLDASHTEVFCSK